MENRIFEHRSWTNNIIPKFIERNNKLIIQLDDNNKKRYEIEFGKLEWIPPIIKEANGKTKPLFPNEARLRNLTYSIFRGSSLII